MALQSFPWQHRESDSSVAKYKLEEKENNDQKKKKKRINNVIFSKSIRTK